MVLSKEGAGGNMKTKMLKLPKVGVVLAVVLLAVTYMVVTRGMVWIYKGIVRVDLPGRYTTDMIKEGLEAIVSIGILYLMGYGYVLKQKGVGLLQGLYISAFLFGYLLAGLTTNIMEYSANPPGKVNSVGEIVIFTVTMLLIGITEEVLMRGCILNLLLDRFSQTCCGIWGAVLIESAIFGALHMTNAFAGLKLTAAFWQSVNAFLIGLVFSAIYIRCKNIWFPIILHATYDFTALMVSGIFGIGSQVDKINSASGVNWVMCLLLTAVTIILLKRKKNTRSNVVVSILMGILSILFSIVGAFWVLGVIGVLAALTSKEEGQSMRKSAGCGMILSAIGALLGIMCAIGKMIV